MEFDYIMTKAQEFRPDPFKEWVMKFTTMLRLIKFWPPFWGAGISVKYFNADITEIIVQMKLRFWNRNYVGTHFGGSIYSMTDPFYMLMLMHALGKNYIIWDKAATIRYKKPAKGMIYARFVLTQVDISKIQKAVDQDQKTQYEFPIAVTNESGEVVAEIQKLLFVAKKQP